MDSESKLAAQVARTLDQKFGPNLLHGVGPEINISDMKPEQTLRVAALGCHLKMSPLLFVNTLVKVVLDLMRLHAAQKVEHIDFFCQLLNCTLQNRWGHVAAAARSMCIDTGKLLWLLDNALHAIART